MDGFLLQTPEFLSSWGWCLIIGHAWLPDGQAGSAGEWMLPGAAPTNDRWRLMKKCRGFLCWKGQLWSVCWRQSPRDPPGTEPPLFTALASSWIPWIGAFPSLPSLLPHSISWNCLPGKLLVPKFLFLGWLLEEPKQRQLGKWLHSKSLKTWCLAREPWWRKGGCDYLCPGTTLSESVAHILVWDWVGEKTWSLERTQGTKMEL